LDNSSLKWTSIFYKGASNQNLHQQEKYKSQDGILVFQQEKGLFTYNNQTNGMGLVILIFD